MNTQTHPGQRTRIPWFKLARLIMIALIIFWIFEMSVGASLFRGYVAQHSAEYKPNNFWSTAQTQAALAKMGWQAATLPWYLLILDSIVTVISLGFAIFILWRKSSDWFGLFLALVFVISLSGNHLTDPVIARIPILGSMHHLLGQFGWQVMFIVFYLFPDGRFVPRWTRWMPLAWLGYNLLDWLFGKSMFNTALNTVVGLSLVLSTIGSQVFRYGWRSTSSQRQQTKWVVAVLAVMMLGLLLLAPNVFKPPTEDTLVTQFRWAVFGGAFFRLSFLLIPAAITIAILRYRLWDIDVIVRKTLVYTVLSGLLGLVFFGAITVLQGLFSSTSNQQSAISIVLSTLAIAAIFNPLRRRIQDFIDRRFYRRKYNAEKALAEFAAAARSETDLGLLSGHLTTTVQEALQPQNITLWLKTAPRSKEN